MAPHHRALTALINSRGVSELIDIADTCIRTSRLMNNVDADEATAYLRHALHAMECMRLLRIAEERAP